MKEQSKLPNLVIKTVKKSIAQGYKQSAIRKFFEIIYLFIIRDNQIKPVPQRICIFSMKLVVFHVAI